MSKIVKTHDGSDTFYSDKFEQNYHSIHGAYTESQHVFIRHGLYPIFDSFDREINIFEVGYGTGLNALLTWKEAKKKHREVSYHSIENYPLDPTDLHSFHLKNQDSQEDFKIITDLPWSKTFHLDYFQITKIKGDIINFNTDQHFHLIYFDAFSPEAQPELWTEEIFHKMYNMLLPNGILTTYCAKGVVKRILKEVGFDIHSPSGPPGKREITIAKKLFT